MQPGDGSWSGYSDRNRKEEFRKLDVEEVLQKVSGFEITTWKYKMQNGSHRHLGCMAQDFYNAFHLNGPGNDTTINSLDIDGVNMAAIQGLKNRTDNLKKVTDELLQAKTDNGIMADKVKDLEAKLATMNVEIANDKLKQQLQIDALTLEMKTLHGAK